jgi:threonyl-tRNA synthetase
MEEGTLALRSRKLGDLGSFAVDDLLSELKRCDDDAVEMTVMGEVAEKEEAPASE